MASPASCSMPMWPTSSSWPRSSDGAPAAVLVDSDTSGVRVERTPSVDLTRRLFSVSFEGAHVSADRLLAEPGLSAAQLLDAFLH